MRAELKKLPLENPGVVLTSETPEEAILLRELWVRRAGPVALGKKDDGNINLVIAPEREVPTNQT